MPAADPLWLHSITTNEYISVSAMPQTYSSAYGFFIVIVSRCNVSPFLHLFFCLSEITDLCVFLVHNYTKPNLLHFPSAHSYLFFARTMFFVPLDQRKIAVHSGAGKMKYTSEHCGHHVMFVNDPLRSTRKKCWAAQKGREIWSGDIQSSMSEN